MELWVRSQSKETLLKISKVHVCDEEIYANTESEFDERIGTYKSKERALEILDEIQACIENLGTGDLPQGISSGYNYDRRVYEMPSK